MSIGSGPTLRLNFPLWQGGNLPEYHFGTQLLAWLAPAAQGPVETVPIPEPEAGARLRLEDGIAGRSVVLRHLREARRAIERHGPARILTLGGDCLVDLPPIAYLNALHRGKLGVLWVDAHPDVMTPKDYPNAHAHVLSALLGRGDPELTGEVETPLAPSRVMYAGLDSWSPVEDEVIQELGLRRAESSMLAETSSPVLEWISDQRIEHIAIHFDLDVLDSRGLPAAPSQRAWPSARIFQRAARAHAAGSGRTLACRSRARLRCGRTGDHRAPAVGHARHAQHAAAAAAHEQLNGQPVVLETVKPSEHTVDRGRRVHRRCARFYGLSNDLVAEKRAELNGGRDCFGVGDRESRSGLSARCRAPTSAGHRTGFCVSPAKGSGASPGRIEPTEVAALR
jgi:arginase